MPKIRTGNTRRPMQHTTRSRERAAHCLMRRLTPTSDARKISTIPLEVPLEALFFTTQAVDTKELIHRPMTGRAATSYLTNSTGTLLNKQKRFRTFHNRAHRNRLNPILNLTSHARWRRLPTQSAGPKATNSLDDLVLWRRLKYEIPSIYKIKRHQN